LLGLGNPLLGVQPPFLGTLGGSGGLARDGSHQGRSDGFGGFLPGILQVLELIAGAVADDHPQALRVEPVALGRAEACEGVLRQALDGREVDAQLNLGGDLVHVLTARASGPHRLEADGLARDADGGGDLDRISHHLIL